MARLSGIQKEVTKLYRHCCRCVYKKPEETRPNWRRFIRGEFAKYREIPKRDFATVEYLIRQGWKRAELYAGEGVRDVR
ncbi:hypothetical protein BABINDRAFT_64094 [Babjeviella inositovora NRRL Y-12698]|uniref:Complex 1 LYR protein domain-containing protein n=1 Tax=Babjeviella inositovora NRRL Y-12698 TaxID=984486 RepID=A0A1E3QNH1_9ASCO|nr:uncharacterized protein BABINDRAFT_64094 [Babjeviella inositovora NRRL Y-12698]ODQ79256.1 hypothetical protein BABINDRAFT_64094 [Babjeviella inositovora NRRL Y-12698]